MLELTANFALIHDIKFLRTISFSQETLQYLYFKHEIVSLAYKIPYTWNMKVFRKFETLNIIEKLLKLEY